MGGGRKEKEGKGLGRERREKIRKGKVGKD